MARYTKTIFVSSLSDLDKIQPGQWVSFDSGNRGQYFGKTEHGTQVIRYQAGKWGKKKHWHGSKLLRQYVVENS